MRNVQSAGDDEVLGKRLNELELNLGEYIRANTLSQPTTTHCE